MPSKQSETVKRRWEAAHPAWAAPPTTPTPRPARPNLTWPGCSRSRTRRIPRRLADDPTLSNGQPAAAAYHRDSDGTHHAFGLGILTATPAGIARITVFGGGPGLVAKFGLPSIHPGRRR